MAIALEEEWFVLGAVLFTVYSTHVGTRFPTGRPKWISAHYSTWIFTANPNPDFFRKVVLVAAAFWVTKCQSSQVMPLELDSASDPPIMAVESAHVDTGKLVFSSRPSHGTTLCTSWKHQLRQDWDSKGFGTGNSCLPRNSRLSFQQIA